MRSSRRIARTVAAFAGVTVLLSGCASYGVDPGGDADSGEITYWMWEAAQLPAYQQCAEDFHRVNPDVDVKIEQFGWDDYWNKLFTGFVANSAPDVFVDHTSRYGEFAARGLIEPIDDRVAADGVDVDAYVKGTTDLWIGPDGKRYGLPKDFDTIGVYYNKTMAAEAGVTEEALKNLTWNPDDGGTYEKTIAHLTVDANGVRGDEPGFDKSKVATYGLGINSSGGPNGQTEWSYLTQTTGWTYMNAKAWGTEFNYDDPRFQATITWWRGLIDKGYMPPLSFTEGGSQDQQMQAGKYAMVTEGSWTLATFAGLEGVEIGLAPTPIGPSGQRAAMQNSLADSIYTSSPRKGAAWKWVKYLASADCQDIVAASGVVMPALQSTTETSKAALAKTGLDITAYTDQIDAGTTFPFPAVLNSAEVNATMTSAMDNVMAFQAEPSSLTAANEKVDALFTR
ncbi:ABC transporter substrate-binding protein [Kineococcus rubinsiae]|uniref:ABC transporter substrate-binding protein n=1 Tax=Kineococcus rubinsiae TaxID=2609562 RepID=UPI00142F7ABB|nr:sugar ABC transporter substrate-binding protein [Kineococcus rubinsiae]NIZ93032.1 sugar ABC transporter substrate-binding protein [Kineococcus rubinsiae]